MSQDQLGLFDTPPDRRQIRLGLALVALMFVTVVLLSALPEFRLRRIDAFIPMVDSIMLVGDIITATLLFVQARVFRSRALTVLASGYVFTSLLLVAHLLTFPGAFAPGGLLGAQLNTTAWIAIFWRTGTPIAIILYVLLKRADSAAQPTERPAAMVAAGLLAALVLAAAVVMLATLGHDFLPQLFVNREDLNHPNFLGVSLATIMLIILAVAMLFPRRKSVLDLWLLVALVMWLDSALVNIQSTGRFTVTFYSQFLFLVLSHLVVMLALLAQSSRLYVRLALSTAARNRERDARLMSMDAVAAAISHEVGQPLTAATVNGLAGLHWLNGPHPDRAKGAAALRDTIDAIQRATDVIKSIRGMFAKRTGSATEFDLNELVRETTGFLERELTGGKVSLELALDEALPPVLADRVQMQQVLINLLTNAIESLGATGDRPRRIAIRSAPVDGEDLTLEVSDTGIGLPPGETERIFDPFFTTKATGTGLGLSLCRTIVEEHRGRIWASPGKAYGATFHVQLPVADGFALG